MSVFVSLASVVSLIKVVNEKNLPIPPAQGEKKSKKKKNLNAKNWNTLPYTKALKLHYLFRDLGKKGYYKGLPVEGIPYSCTHKRDGTQIQLGINLTPKEDPLITMLSHNGHPLCEDKAQLTMEELKSGFTDKNGNHKDYFFQRVPLWTAFGDVIPNLMTLMHDNEIDEAFFYFELILLNAKTGMGLTYPEDIRGTPELFQMVYAVPFPKEERTAEGIEDKVKLFQVPVSHETQPIFQKYGIKTVFLVKELCGDSLTLENMISAFNYVHSHPEIEGVVFSTPFGTWKLLTHHNSEPCNEKYDLPCETSAFYRNLQEEYIKVMKRPRIKTLNSERVNKGIVKGLIEIEINKELGHDSHTETIDGFYSIPRKQKMAIKRHITGSKLYADVISSVEELRPLTDEEKEMAVNLIACHLITNKSTLKSSNATKVATTSEETRGVEKDTGSSVST